MYLLFRFLKATNLGYLIWKLTGYVLVQETDNHSIKYYWTDRFRKELP